MKQIIMSKDIITKFKKVYKSEISPRLKRKDKLNFERNKLDSERDKLSFEINKLNSERNKLDYEINKLNSEINKLNSEILMIFYNFGKENNCAVNWKNYSFKLKDIKLKTYNKDKTGFLFIDMNGQETEELFKPKPEEYKVINGYKYKLVEDD